MVQIRLVLIISACLFLASAKAAISDDIDLGALELSLYGDGIYQVADHNKAEGRLKAFEKEFKGGDRKVMAERMNYATRYLVNLTVKNLTRRGFGAEAMQIKRDWKRVDGELQRVVASNSRDITTFDPWSKTLANIGWTAIGLLGFDLAHSLRVTDLITFAYTPPVIFHPCKYGAVEFGYHFTEQNPSSPTQFRGGFPTTIFWLSNITCSVGTFSAGLIFPVCGVLSSLIELGAREYLSPRLEKFIFEKSCSK